MGTPISHPVEDITNRLCHNGMPRDSAISDLCIEAAAFMANMSAKLAALEADARRKSDALAVALLWAMDSEGGYTDLTKKYYDWATAVKEKIPGNPQMKDVLDAALSQNQPKEDEMTDLEMTKKCAEAIGIPICEATRSDGKCMAALRGGPIYDPLEIDGQAMALMKKFGLSCRVPELGVWEVHEQIDSGYSFIGKVHVGTNLNRAIVECVAKMQSSKTGTSAATTNETDKPDAH